MVSGWLFCNNNKKKEKPNHVFLPNINTHKPNTQIFFPLVVVALQNKKHGMNSWLRPWTQKQIIIIIITNDGNNKKQQQNHQEIMIMSFVFGGFEQKHTNRYSIHLHKYTKTRFDRQGKNQLKRQWQWYYWGPDAMAMAISQLDIFFLSKYVYLSIYLFILI